MMTQHIYLPCNSMCVWSEEVTLEFFKAVQEKLSTLVRIEPFDIRQVEVIGALDVAYVNDLAIGAAISWDLRRGLVIGSNVVRSPVSFPYVPGLLYLREGPAMLSALRGLEPRPSLVLVDGHGLAHPRRAGIASIIGVLSGLPTIGVAKGLLHGEVVVRGGKEVLVVQGEPVGMVVRSGRKKPTYFSIGHMVDLATIEELVEIIGHGYPRPLIEADKIARESIG